METPDIAPETLEEFKNSFSYGSRSNLNFKFLKSLPPEEAGEFFQQLVGEISSSYDHGSVDPIHHLVNEWQIRAYTPAQAAMRPYVYDDGPFSPLAKPLSESRLALLTSSGHFVAGDDPEPFGVQEMSQQEAEDRVQEFLRSTPKLSEIPVDVDVAELRVRHGGYPVASAAIDHNVALPLDHLHAAAADGRIGELAPTAFSFSGATSQGRLRKEALPGWIDRLRDHEIDVMLLVPV
jgi:D-proline reductase (dithiol) PrdB